MQKNSATWLLGSRNSLDSLLLKPKPRKLHNPPHRTMSMSISPDIFGEENKLKTIAKLEQHVSPLPGEKWVGKALPKKAAVLVPLCFDEFNRPSILFTLRSTSLGTHAGEISFPGGKIDEADKGDFVKTALRETHEEVGIPPTQVQVWGVLPSVPTVTSLMRVAPVLGLIHKPLQTSTLIVNKDEVALAFAVPIEHLCDSRNWDVFMYPTKRSPIPLPIFINLEKYLGASNSHVKLWGLTALVTHLVLLALAPEHYNRKSFWS